jgi:aminopeptidase N
MKAIFSSLRQKPIATAPGWLLAGLLCFPLFLMGQNRSDTFDLRHYALHLDLTQIKQGTFQARADIHLAAGQNMLQQLRLDLLPYTVDTVLWRQASGPFTAQGISYNHQGENLFINWNQALQQGDSLELRIRYHGSPVVDASGWGGFHTDQGYFYNLGVGFAAQPHSYGRAWFPCFDNFTEKSTYELSVDSRAPLRPLLSGDTLTETALGGDTIRTTSRLEQPTPSYLVSFALSRYVFLRDTVQGLQGTKSILLASKPADTAKLRQSFQHLKGVFHAFEKHFGPYRWPRVGYALTTVGAMEHATSISYPRSLVDGSLDGEDIMAHELAHHWFGNLITCQSDDDMWINEGMAEFCSHLYTEDLYGRSRYLDVVRENAWNVLNEAHRRDGGYRPLYDPPHNYVYGYTVYQKGAMVGHNLRHYLGDSLFFQSLRQLMQRHAYGNLSTSSFRDELIRITGHSELQAFWDDWIYAPGFPQFSVNDWQYQASTGQTQLVLRQRLHQAPQNYREVPVDVTFFGPQGQSHTRSFVHSGDTSHHPNINLPFIPKAALASYSGQLLTATGNDHLKIDSSGSYRGRYSGITIQARQLQDTGSVLVQHHLVKPELQPGNPFDFNLSDHHYFTIQPLSIQGHLSAVLPFDGSSRGRDDDLTRQGNDSLQVVYRPRGKFQWRLYPYQIKQTSNPDSPVGTIELDSLRAGDYALVNTAEVLSHPSPQKGRQKAKLFPQPAQERLKVVVPAEEAREVPWKLFSPSGQLLRNGSLAVKPPRSRLLLSLKNLPGGSYHLQLGRKRFTFIHP